MKGLDDLTHSDDWVFRFTHPPFEYLSNSARWISTVFELAWSVGREAPRWAWLPVWPYAKIELANGDDWGKSAAEQCSPFFAKKAELADRAGWWFSRINNFSRASARTLRRILAELDRRDISHQGLGGEPPLAERFLDPSNVAERDKLDTSGDCDYGFPIESAAAGVGMLHYTCPPKLEATADVAQFSVLLRNSAELCGNFERLRPYIDDEWVALYLRRVYIPRALEWTQSLHPHRMRLEEFLFDSPQSFANRIWPSLHHAAFELADSHLSLAMTYRPMLGREEIDAGWEADLIAKWVSGPPIPFAELPSLLSWELDRHREVEAARIANARLLVKQFRVAELQLNPDAVHEPINLGRAGVSFGGVRPSRDAGDKSSTPNGVANAAGQQDRLDWGKLIDAVSAWFDAAKDCFQEFEDDGELPELSADFQAQAMFTIDACRTHLSAVPTVPVQTMTHYVLALSELRKPKHARLFVQFRPTLDAMRLSLGECMRIRDDIVERYRKLSGSETVVAIKGESNANEPQGADIPDDLNQNERTVLEALLDGPLTRLHLYKRAIRGNASKVPTSFDNVVLSGMRKRKLILKGESGAKSVGIQLSESGYKVARAIVAKKTGSSRNFVAGSLWRVWSELQSSAEEQDAGAVVGEVSKAAGGRLEGLDAAVEALGRGVADRVPEPRDDPFPMSPEHLRHFDHRWQAAPHRPGIPVAEEGPPLGFRRLIPEVSEEFPDGPRLRGFQRRVFEVLKGGFSLGREMLLLRQPEVAAAGQAFVAGPSEVLMLGPPHAVDRLPQMLTDVKLVMHDGRLGDVLGGAVQERRPHVHRHRLNLLALHLGQRVPQRIGRFPRAAGGDFQHSPAVDVGQHRDVVVTPAEVLLVDPHVRDVVEVTPRQAAFDRLGHDRLRRVPVEPQESAGLLDAGRRLQDVDRKRLEQQREAAVRLGPGNGGVQHPALRTVRAGHAGDEDRLELHRVQMPPLPFGSMILERPAPDSGSSRQPHRGRGPAESRPSEPSRRGPPARPASLRPDQGAGHNAPSVCPSPTHWPTHPQESSVKPTQPRNSAKNQKT